MLPHIHTNDGVTVVVHGRAYTVSADHQDYERLIDMIEVGEGDDRVYAVLQETANRLRDRLALAPDMEYSGGVVTYRGEVLHNYAVERLVSLIDAKRDHAPLANFLAKLQENPSKRVVDNLYAFLEKGNIPLAEDGDFVAYKAVRSDYKDIHSGTFDNGLGAVCEMPRNRVDEDANRTCSTGLHVCSFSYLPHFSHANGHVMVVKVSPADVVAIPADYNDSKMRVSRYEVIGEVEDYYTKGEDVLGNVGRSTGVLEPMFTLTDEDGEEVGSFYTLEEAKRQAKAYQEDTDLDVTVEDEEGYVVWTVTEYSAG